MEACKEDRTMAQPQFIIEEVTDPQEIARAQAQDERHRRNNE